MLSNSAPSNWTQCFVVWCKSLCAIAASFSAVKMSCSGCNDTHSNFRFFFSLASILETVAISLHALTLVKKHVWVPAGYSGDTVLLEGEGERLI